MAGDTEEGEEGSIKRQAAARIERDRATGVIVVPTVLVSTGVLTPVAYVDGLVCAARCA